MWRNVGLFRSREGLETAAARMDAAYEAARDVVRAAESSADRWRHFNLVGVARLVAHAALRREESRGAHFRADFPARDDERWRWHAVDVIE
jgi:succinate dehydrogenase/fumarate reductase flavoprotein subunit